MSSSAVPAIRVSDLPLILSYSLSFSPEPLLFLGPPGIGKTASVALFAVEYAEKRKKKLVDVGGDACNTGITSAVLCPRGQRELLEAYHMVEKNPDKYFVYLRLVGPQVTPEDLQYPRVVGDAVAVMPPLKLAFLAVPGVEGLLFIDEITNVRREDAKTMLFALVNERTLGLGGQLSSNVLVVAAGNPPEVSSAAELLPAPLTSRFIIYNVEPPTPSEFVSIYERHCRGAEEVPAFLLVMAAQGENLVYQPPAAEETNENYPTPRTWCRLGRMLMHLPRENGRVVLATAVGAVGRRVGSMFYAFLRVKPPRPEELLENPGMYKSLDTEKRLMSLVYLARHVANHADNDTLSKYARFIAENIEDFEEEMALSLAFTLKKLSKKPMLVESFVRMLMSMLKKKSPQVRKTIIKTLSKMRNYVDTIAKAMEKTGEKVPA